MQGNIRARPGIWGRREVIGVGFAGDFKNSYFNTVWHSVVIGKPLGGGPGFHNRFSIGITRFGLFVYVMKGVKHQ